MAAPGRTLSLYKSLLREIKSLHKKDSVKDIVAYQYVRRQFREHNVTSEKMCRDKGEMEYLASSYLCLLQSVKMHEALHAMYKGKGERSIESAARLVGLELPKQNLSEEEPSSK